MNQIKELDEKGYFKIKLDNPSYLSKIESMVKSLIDNELIGIKKNLKKIKDKDLFSKYEILIKSNKKGKSRIYNLLKNYVGIDLLFNDTQFQLLLQKIFISKNYFKLFQACRLDHYPNNNHALNWHQDAFQKSSYINLRDCITIWMPINKSVNHGLFVIEGSHKGNHKQIVTQRKNKSSSEKLELKLNLCQKFITKNTKLIKINKGEALIMSMALAHKSNQTYDKELRMTCLSRFISLNSKHFNKVSKFQ